MKNPLGIELKKGWFLNKASLTKDHWEFVEYKWLEISIDNN